MQDIHSIRRLYRPFDYYGARDAEYVIVAMGSVCDTIGETVDYLNKRGEKTGVVKVRLYRPFSAKHFFDILPRTVKRIAVLDRTKEPGAPGEPLYLDVVKLFYDTGEKPLIVGGRYGLGSKDTRPSQILAVFRNLMQKIPRDHFTIGIVDDVTNTSLPDGRLSIPLPEGTISCKFFGLGSDGTVRANKGAVQIIGGNTDLHVQAYFSYDSKSLRDYGFHLRFGPKPLKSPYLVYKADYIACHNKSFIYNYDILKGLKPSGTFVLNCPWQETQLDNELPAAIKRYIAGNNIRFYIIDAIGIAGEIGLGNRINMIMQAAFFKVANIIPVEDAARYLKEMIEKMYGKKGRKIVEMNNKAVDMGIERLVEVKVPESWKDAADEGQPIKEEPEFKKRVHKVMTRMEGDELPVSAFAGMEDGSWPPGTTAYEKRGIAVMIPQWQIEKCIQCNQCSYICPHATIRPFLLDEEEAARAPESFETKQAIGKGLENYQYRIQLAPLDCTGCSNCANVCPAKGKALIMKPAEQEILAEAENWEFAMTLKDKGDVMNPNTVKGSQFRRPLLEFNGACPGCGETPYIRLLTQLFGDRMMIANATGCSSIWGASAPSMAYSTDEKGRGPAWANSLFEDNAEYGYGMYLGVKQVRERLSELMTEALKTELPEGVKNALRKWLETREDGEASKAASRAVLDGIKDIWKKNPLLAEIMEKKDFLAKRSFWIIGGDGWAYDIGYGGVDHVLAMGDDVNLFVMDTEIYSNTGGQASKSTPASAVAKFAAAGKKTRKKDLGLMAMSYGYVYVAQIAMGADMNQTIRAITEAESYPGPSLIIAYSPVSATG